LERIRLARYAVDRGEGNPAFWCVAAPLTDSSGVVGSIGTVAPSVRLRREEAATAAVILEIARAIGALQTALPARNDRVGAGNADPEAATQAAIESALATIAEAMSRVG
jgi:hypothetical protein